MVEAGLKINVDTPLTEAAQRAMTRDRSVRYLPLVCTDAAGRYVGVVPVERLVNAVSALADQAGVAARG